MRLECGAILFDLDGVLIDSTQCVERHWRSWAGRHGLDAEGILRIAHGVRNVETMGLVAPHLDVEREAAEFAAHEVEDTAGVVAVQGAHTFLASLEHAPWAIVTSCSAELARGRMQTAQIPAPPVLVTGSDVSRGKPDPQPYLLAAARLDIQPPRCVVFEDAPAGVRAGKSAGMHVVGIAFTYPRCDLAAAGADVVVARLMDVHLRNAGGADLVLTVAGD